jgi:hypothetical protein
MKILKYRVHPGMNTLPIPGDNTAKLRYLNDQDGKLVGWVEVTPTTDVPTVEYEVYLALTGEDIPNEYNYVCSYQQLTGGGYFVVHAFD